LTYLNKIFSFKDLPRHQTTLSLQAFISRQNLEKRCCLDWSIYIDLSG
jgi:hypothetical protein